jgi:hypothetical protein
MVKDLFKKHLFIIVFTFSGAVAGFLYWKLIGCKTGSCPIKSVWYMSTLWGLIMGYLSGSIIKDLVISLSKKDKQGSSDSNTGGETGRTDSEK